MNQSINQSVFSQTEVAA